MAYKKENNCMRWLTKSYFRLGMECPSKLCYVDRENYLNQKINDEFLEALAEGGLQVGKLAQVCCAPGEEVKETDHEEALKQTAKLLRKDEITIFEAALAFEGMFVRVDILRKNANRIELIEVKAKSWSPGEDRFLTAHNPPRVISKWRPYIYELAFQTHVAEGALPGLDIVPSLLLVNKLFISQEDGLYQKFRVVDHEGDKRVEITDDWDVTSAREILVNVDVKNEVEFARSGTVPDGPLQGRSFTDAVKELHAQMGQGSMRNRNLEFAPCRECEFRTTEAQRKQGYRDGRWECWRTAFGWDETDCTEPNVFDLSGRLTNPSRSELIRAGSVKLRDLDPDLFHAAIDGTPDNLSNPRLRQRLQIEAARNGICQPVFLAERFREISDKWEWPLHFIDFETCTPPLPLYKSMRPYETVAFQFSHHVLHKNGRLEHHGEWLNPDPGEYPHIMFLEKLRESLGESGTVFRWAAHENTVLNHIGEQLTRNETMTPHIRELIDWIAERTQRREGGQVVCGERNMVDQRKLALELTFDPSINGLTGIKKVLLSTIRNSRFLQERYGRPCYGTEECPSRNFQSFQWVRRVDNEIQDPYELLPPITLGPGGPDISRVDEDFCFSEQLKNGGAAMSAYLELAVPTTDDHRRSELRKALLKYCELDTLAMAMIMQDWLGRAGVDWRPVR
ncbi:MAG: hypothetical protein Kow0020_12490 [Wenzhouxiangellaceae bacterium]